MWSAGGFPGVLEWRDGPPLPRALLLVGVGGALALASGLAVRTGAVVAWYVWTSVFLRNPLTTDPSQACVGFLLLACLFVPPRARAIPRPVLAAAWLVMAAAYSYSGATKLVSPSWIDGSALARLLDSPLVYDGPLRHVLGALPAPLLALATWAVLGLELGFAPLALVRRLRAPLWAALAAVHLGLLALVAFAPLSLGMLLLHAFTFDPRWWPRRAPAPPPLAESPAVS